MAQIGAPMRKASKRLCFLLAISSIVIALVYVVGSFVSYQHIVEQQLLEVARSLRISLQASWDYIDESQMLINYNSDGSYDFKGVYCSVAGKRIAQKFNHETTTYDVRYVRHNPRSGTDAPDEFETLALDQFETGGQPEYYDFAPLNGTPMFRYAYLLEAKPGCLECHGTPAGEKDITGFIKEGMQPGDVAGAVSIAIPLSAFEQERQSYLLQAILFFLVLIIGLVTLIRQGVQAWIARPLEEKAERHKRESEEKSNILSIMSHELRTPLSSIVAFADMWERDLAEGRKRNIDDDAAAVHEIKENGQILMTMVNNTIDLARIEAGRYELHPEEGDLADVVGAALAATRPLAQKKGVRIAAEIPEDVPITISDWEAMRKILVNLVGNAIKFTDAGGSVTIAAHYDERKSTCILKVSDTGCGIAAENQERIFERFSQSSIHVGSQTGSGLGLAVVRNLSEMLGGSVSVESAIDQGSTFTVVIPTSASKLH